MKRSDGARLELLHALAAGAVPLVVYLLTRSEVYSYDALDYASSIREGAMLFHPPHVLYNFLMHGLWNIAQAALPRADALYVLATADAVFTAFTVALLWRFLRWTGASRIRAWTGAMLWAGLFSTWKLATTVEVYPLFLLLVFALTLLLAYEHGSWGWFALGLAFGFCILLHQMAALVVLVVFVALIIRPHAESRKQGFLFLGGAILVSLAGFVTVAAFKGITTISGFLRWIFFYTSLPEFQGGSWASIDWSTPVRGLAGALSVFVYPWWMDRWIGHGVAPGLSATLGLVAVAAILLAGLCVALRTVRRAGTPGRKTLLRTVLGLWAAVSGVFALVWEPTNFEFWHVALLPLIAWTALRTRAVAVSRPSAVVIVSAVLALWAFNGATRFYHDSRKENNEVFAAARKVRELMVEPSDMVLSSWLELQPAVRYLYGESLNLESILRISGLGATEEVFTRLDSMIQYSTLHGMVFISDDEMEPDDQRLWYYRNLDREDIRRFYDPYRLSLEPQTSYVHHGKTIRVYALVLD